MARTDPSFARHLTDWTLDELQNAAHAVRDLRNTPGWSILLSVLDAERDVVQGKLERGDVALQQADYALAHGKLHGLRSAQLAAEAIIEKAAEAEAKAARQLQSVGTG